MKQVILNIPEGEFDFFMKLVKKFKYTTTESEDFEISEETKQLVESRRETAKKDDYISITKSNQKLKKKYGL